MNFEQISKFLIAVIPVISLSCAVFIYLYIKSVFERRRKIELFQNEFQKIKESNQELIKTYGSLTYLENQRKELEEKLLLYEKKYNELNQTIAQAQIQANALDKEINDKRTFNSSLLKMREEELGRMMELKKEKEIERVDREVGEWEVSAQEAAREYFEIQSSSFDDQILIKQKELQSIIDTIKDYHAKVDAINAEIIRARIIEEQQSFYQVQLSPESLHDIALLREIKSQFSKFDLLEKLIYDNYIKKPVDEMIKRVLAGRAPCGIYKITRLKTKEIYIGKSTDVASRWRQHAKSAFHCGTISHSILHTTIENDGVENFIWELLEEVEKEKLNEREKYWIDFYDSKTYGLNEKAGG